MSELPTFETAPAGYSGPVRLTPAQRARTAQLHAQWIETLRAQARDDGDPEIQQGAQFLLKRDGLGW